MIKQIFTAVVYKEGKSVEEALENLKEATELYLEKFEPVAKSNPLFTTFEVTHT